MTQRERSMIERTIILLMGDGFHEGIATLCGLIGWKYPASAVLRKAKQVSVQEVASSPNRQFRAEQKAGE